MKTRAWRAILLVLAVTVVAGIVGTRIARHQGTAPHETPAEDPYTVTLQDGVNVLLSGCFPSSGAGPGLTVRAISLSPRMTFVSESGDPCQIDVIVTNVSTERTEVTGAQRTDSGEIPGTVRFSVDLPGGAPKNVELNVTGERDLFSFYVFGDNRTRYHVLEKIFEDAAGERPLFVFNSGDLVNNGTHEELQEHMDAVADLPVPYFTALGNHDTTRHEHKADAYVELFGPTYYSFEYGNSFFIVLDNGTGYVSRKQLKWLHTALQKGKEFAHTFVFAHYPPFDPRRGHHHCMKPFVGGVGALMRLLKDGDIDFFFAGHLHAYYEIERNGVNYIISGGAGADMSEPFPYHHYVVVIVDGDAVSTEFRLVGSTVRQRRGTASEHNQ